MTTEVPDEILAMLDDGSSIESINAALRAYAPRGTGIKEKTVEWRTVLDSKCPSGIAEQYCVHIVWDNGSVFDKCGMKRCVAG